MNYKIIFISGVFGVGKTTITKKIAEKLNVLSYSAGSLIKDNNPFLLGVKPVHYTFENKCCR